MDFQRRKSPALVTALLFSCVGIFPATAEPINSSPADPAVGAPPPSRFATPQNAPAAHIAAIKAPPSRFAGPSESTKKMVRTALSFRGARYRYGGSSRRGFDCSGFMKYLYQAAKGVSLPRTSAAQSRYGKKVALKDIQPGDLLFFRSRGRRVGHVGMYVGNGQMIHAVNPRRGVRVDRFQGSYWYKRFSGARRPS